jgi:TonB-dependent starch-binding outer membrane protein SusC
MKNFSMRRAGGAVCLFSSAVCGFWAQDTYANHGFAPWRADSFQQQKIQQQTVSGVVSDSGGVLPGVTVSVKGSANRDVVTDADGRFSIAAAPGEVLAFSFIGFRTQELTVSSSVALNVLMTTDATALQEVTVNAGYYSVKERERTGSIAKITSKDIETQPVTNVLAAMQGRMAGVDIVQTTGTPGGGFDVLIRGRNSLRPNAGQPLYVIDGVPYSSEPLS